MNKVLDSNAKAKLNHIVLLYKRATQTIILYCAVKEASQLYLLTYNWWVHILVYTVKAYDTNAQGMHWSSKAVPPPHFPHCISQCTVHSFAANLKGQGKLQIKKGFYLQAGIVLYSF